jgi:hypothetical protein
MNIVITEAQIRLLKYIGATILVALICSGITYHYTAKHYQEKYNALNAQFDAFKAEYSSVINEKEQAIIDKAIAEKKANTPVKEYLKGETVTQLQWVEKESKSDASVEINSKTNPIVVSYNGKKEELPTTTTEGKDIKDGKVVVTQQTTATLDIDSIVNRQIANRILEDEHKEKVLKREKTQQTIWGTVAGFVIGKYVSD